MKKYLALLSFLLVTGIFAIPQSARADFIVSGALYSDEGSTLITSAKTIKMSINGQLATSTLSASGLFTISTSTVLLNQPIAIWVDGDATTRAFTLTKATSTASMTIPLYQNRITLIDHSTTTLSTADLALADNTFDSDIQFKVTGNDLTTFAGQKLFIAAYTVFVAAGAVTTSGNAAASPDGDFGLGNLAVYNAGATTTIAGNLLASTTALYFSNGYTTSFTASTSGKVISGPFAGSTGLASTTFNGSGGAWTISGSASTTNVQIVSGTVTPPNLFSVAGNFANSGTYSAGSGTTTFTPKGLIGSVDVSGGLFAGGGAKIGYSASFATSTYLYILKGASAIECGSIDKTGCEMQIFDVSSSTNTVYFGGVDSGGTTNSGTQSSAMNDIFISGRYAYVAKSLNSTDCSNPIGCEIQIYDLSDPAAPVYVAGIDGSGSANSGTGSITATSLFVSGNYLYVTQTGNATSCASSNKIGCELSIYDISNPLAPTFVGGADADGSTNSGTSAGQNFNKIFVSGNYAYIAASASSTACSSTAGIGSGCELKVFDVSTPSSPTYVGGADAGGSANSGTMSSTALNVSVSGSYAYVGFNSSASACSSTPSNANGCELKIFDVSTPSTPTLVAGVDAGGGINTGTVNAAATAVSISGSYVYVGYSSNTATCTNSGSTSGCELKIFDISTPTAPVFVGGADSTGATNSGTGGTIAFNALAVVGNAVWGLTDGSIGGCDQTLSRFGCEIYTFDVSDKTAPQFQNGLDASVYGGATASSQLNQVYVVGSYAYVVKNGDATNCASPNNHSGCELQIYDISAHGNPRYMGGADADGTTNGGTSSGQSFRSIQVVGNYAYVGSTGSTTACTASAGAGNGCELKVFDISNPAVPTYVGGADGSGSTNSGTTFGGIFSLVVSGNYLYAGMAGSNGTCSSTPGSALGCEFEVYDISTPASPTYVGGADDDGTTNGGSGLNASFGVSVVGSYAYVIFGNSSGTCSSTPGSAVGCELKVFDISTPSTPTYLGGADAGGSTNSGTMSVFAEALAISGSYAYVAFNGDTGACSGTAGNTNGCEIKIFDISTPSTPTYVAGIDASGTTNSGTVAATVSGIYKFGNYMYASKSGNATTCASTTDKQGCETQVYDVSNPATPIFVSGIDGSGAINSGTQAVASDYTFATSSYLYVVKAANTTDCVSAINNKAGCEFLVYNLGDLTNSTSTVSGTLTGTSALGNVVATTSLQFASNASTTNFTIFSGTTTPSTLLSIGGNYINNGGFQAGSGTVYLNGTTPQSLSGTLSGSSGFYNLTITNTSGSPTSSFSVQFGATTTASSTFTMLPGTSARFLAGATSTFANINWQGTSGSNIWAYSSVTDTLWGLQVTGTATAQYVKLKDSNACAGGANLTDTNGTDNGNNTCWTFTVVATGSSGGGGGDVGGSVSGAGSVGGGSDSGGTDNGSGSGQSIGNEAGFFAATNVTTPSGWSGWTNASNGYTQDSAYATANAAAASDYFNFGFSVPSSDVVNGFTIKILGSASGAGGTVGAELSWNGGTSTTTSGVVTSAFTTTDTVYTLGSASNTFGRTWTPSELSNANFHLRIKATPSSNTLKIDAIQVNVYHTSSGGSHGGGGDI
jgi:hypothetical protein